MIAERVPGTLAPALPLRDILLALVPPVCWGATFPIAKPALVHFPPLAMMSMVYALTAAIMLLLMGRPATPAPRLTVLAFLVGAGQGALLFTGLAALPASTAMLAVQAQTPFAVLAAWLLDGERPSAKAVLGILVAMIGIGMVGGAPELPASPLPLLLVVGSALVWATGQVLVKRLSRDPGARLSGGIYLHATWQMALLSLLLERGQAQAIGTASAGQWALVLMLAAFGFALAYGIWYQLLARIRIETIASFPLLTPVVTLAVAALVLHETPSAMTWAGAAVVLLGIALIVMPRGASPRSRTNPA
jgi:O-acetylserine/cysteine efflux transporter